MRYKLVVMGSSSVGKSALTVQLVKSSFLTDHEATVEDSYRTRLVVDGEQCQLDIVDTSGSEGLKNRRPRFMRAGQGFLCVYAVDDIKSFVEVNIFRDQLRQIKGTERVPFVLVANKTDEANWLVAKELGQELAKSFKVPFVEASAKTRRGVEDAFHQLVQEVRKAHAQELKDRPQPEQNQCCGCKKCTIQ